MRIERLHIDRFGILADQEIPSLSPGLNVVLGHNEAGKSTLLRFFQSMLFGYKRGNRSLDPMPGKRGQSGGSLLLQTKTEGRVLLTRRPGAHGGVLSLADDQGQPLDESLLNRVFSGLTVDVFDAIFAFSLKNLMEFSSLKGDSVRHALHGAAFGLGLRSPAQVLKTLDDRMGLLLKRDSAQAAINNVLRELAEVQEELRSAVPDMQLYADLQQQLDGLDARLADALEKRAEAGRRLGKVQRRMAVWRQWEALRRVRTELEGLGEVPGKEDLRGGAPTAPAGPVFTPDAVQRLDALLAQKEERILAVRQTGQACALLQADISRLGDPRELASLHQAVQALREEKNVRQSEAGGLAGLALSLRQLEERQAETLRRLGPEWHAARIAAAEVSMGTRETVLQWEQQLREKEQLRAEKERECLRLEEELAEALRQEDEARSCLAAVPRSRAPLPDKTEATDMASALAKAKDALALLPGLREKEKRARDELGAALADIDPAWTLEDLEHFDSSLGAKQRLADHSAALAEARDKELEAKRDADLAEEQRDEATWQATAARERLKRYADLPDSDTLDARHAHLRRLQILSLELDAARRVYESANEAVSNAVAPLKPKKRGGPRLLAANPFFLSGVLLFAAGFALGGWGYFSMYKALLYTGTGLGLSGLAVCLLLGLAITQGRTPGTDQLEADEEVLRKARALANDRRQLVAAELSTAARRASSWLSAADPHAPDEADLSRAARILENQGRQLALLERDQQECQEAENALRIAQTRLDRAADRLREAGDGRQIAEQAWLAYLTALRLDSSMKAENAAGIFDRAAAARARAEAWREAVSAREQARQVIAGTVRLAFSLPFFADALETAAKQATQVEDAPVANPDADGAAATLPLLDKALESLAQHEETEQQALRLASVLQEREDIRLRLHVRLDAARSHAEGTASALATAREGWQHWLAELGFSASYSPSVVLTALEDMQAFLERQKDIVTLRAKQKDTVVRLALFGRETAALAARAGLPLPSELDAWLASQTGAKPDEPPQAEPAAGALLSQVMRLLDQLGSCVDTAAGNAALLHEKQEQLFIREQELARHTAALELTEGALLSLLAGAGMEDAEHFRAAFALFQEKEQLRRAEQDHAAALLALAAEEGRPLEEVMAELEESSLAALREEEQGLAEAIALLEKERSSLSEERGQVRERRAALVGGEGTAPLRRREAALREDAHRLARQWMVPALGRELLLRAKQRFEEEGQQGVIRHAGDLFAAITAGEYTGLAASLDGDVYTALHNSGDRRDPEKQLSQGAREQLYLALRLAYIKNHASKAESLPVIMDDILVNFDPQRAANTAKVLASFAADNQLLFFTCHPGTAERLLNAGRANETPAPAGFSIRRGEITPLVS